MRNVKGNTHADAKKPEALMRLYVLTALFSIAVVLFLTGVGIHRIYARHIIGNAEEDAINISKALLEDEREVLVSAGPAGRSRLEAVQGEAEPFDRRIRKFLQAFSIVKIKIYNGKSRIIYSTDPTIIGKLDAGNARLERSLRGSADSKLQNKHKVIDLAGEQKFDVDVVETYVPVRDATGIVIGSFEIYMDVTRYRSELTNIVAMSVSILATILLLVFAASFLLIRRGTLQLKDAQAELVRQEKLALFGMIAAGMGNELRNPLGVMNNAVYFLQSMQPDATETVKEYLEIIRQEIGNSQRIISDLLDYYRITAPRTAEVPVDALLRESLANCSIPANVLLRIETEEMPFAVRVDSDQMAQVLRNLVTNAVQAMPDGGDLRIAARRVSSGVGAGLVPAQSGQPQGLPLPDFVEISVTDTGAGIEPENLTKLFQPLFTTKSRGIGLGLAISQKLIEANGGRIEVESKLGNGTTFMLMLPEGGE